MSKALIDTPECTVLALRGSRTGLWTWSLDSRLFEMSAEFRALLGFEPNELPDGFAGWLNRLHHHDRETVLDAFTACITGQSPSCDCEARLRHKDGKYHWLLLRGGCRRDSSGYAVHITGTAVDITRLKAAEADLARRQRLSSKRLHEAQDAERRHVVRELHDDIGEVLTALNLALETGALACADAARPAVLTAQALVRELVTRVHELSVGLRPPMLDDLGLVPAVAWHVERYRLQTGIVVTFQHAEVADRRYAPAVEIAIYRIIQEALTNVARHAKVTSAVVRMWQTEGALGLQIQDTGAGFEANDAPLHGGGGLFGMRERAVLLGGDLTIETQRGRGTLVTAHLPLDAAPDGSVK